jgi:hypothetical protein
MVCVILTALEKVVKCVGGFGSFGGDLIKGIL